MLYELAASTYYHILPYIGLRSLNQSLQIFFRRNTAGRPGIGILLVCKLPNSVYEKSPTSINAILVGTGEQFITLFDDKMLMMHDEHCWCISCISLSFILSTLTYILVHPRQVLLAGANLHHFDLEVTSAMSLFELFNDEVKILARCVFSQTKLSKRYNKVARNILLFKVITDVPL